MSESTAFAAVPSVVRRLSEDEARSPLGVVEPGERLLVAPGLLDAGSNIRGRLPMSDGFVETIRSLGVLEDIQVYPALTGLVVLDGHRRLEGAIRAGLDVVPCRVVAVETEQSRLERQLVMNDEHHRVTALERAQTIHQLALLGVPRQDIHRRTGAHLPEIKAAGVVVRADESVKRAGLESGLDLMTLAQVTEVVERVEAAGVPGEGEKLLAAVVEHPEQAPHLIEAASRTATGAEREAEVLEALRADGVRCSREVDFSRWRALGELVDERGELLDPGEHASCPGHLVLVSYLPWRDEVKQEAGCVDWAGHGHRNRFAAPSSGATSGPMREEVRAERVRVRARTEAWVAACEVRRRWIREVLLARRVPSDAAEYEFPVVRWAHRCVMPAVWETGRAALEVQVPDEAVSLLVARKGLLAWCLAAVEGSIERDSWRSERRTAVFGEMLRHHLEWLAGCGYGLAEIEVEVMRAVEEAAGE